MNKWQSITLSKFMAILSFFLILLGLYFTSFYSYLLFHSLSEIFSIIIACGIFMVAWNSRRFLENNYLLFLGLAYLFVGGLDLIHTLAYKGMGVFQGYDANLPTQLWISARSMEGITLLLAPLYLKRKLNFTYLFYAYSLATAILLGAIFYWDIFPVCFIEGIGLTPFKKISEYLISLILLIAMVLLIINRREFDKSVLNMLVFSIIMTIGSELAFTFYISVYGISNLIGHYFKIISFYLIYKAIIETGLEKPYDLLFRNLKKNEQLLQQANDDMQLRVEERTGELMTANKQLKREIEERKKVEEALRESEKRLRFLSNELLKTQETERKRVARELHDGIGQSLTAIKYKIEKSIALIQTNGVNGVEGKVESLGTIIPMIQNGIDEVRRIGMDLRPSILDDLGILATINWLCREYQKIYGHIRLEKEIKIEEKDVPDHLKTVIYRLLQEAMNNIAKHSQADLVQIRLEKKDHIMEVVIEDNGTGFDPEPKLPLEGVRKGFGLVSMRERTEHSDGFFTLNSVKGMGTTIRARWQLARENCGYQD